MSQHALEFRITAACTGWDETTLKCAFLHSLSDVIKAQLVSRNEPQSLNELLQLAVRIDTRFAEQKWGKNCKLHDRPLHGSHHTSACTLALELNYQTHSPPELRQTPIHFPVLEPEEELMQVGHTHLTLMERRWQVNKKACTYCGKTGHFIVHYPLLGNEFPHQ